MEPIPACCCRPCLKQLLEQTATADWTTDSADGLQLGCVVATVSSLSGCLDSVSPCCLHAAAAGGDCLLMCQALDSALKKPYRVAYQGVPGAYSEMAACKACPNAEPVPCEQFEVAFQVR